MEFVEVFELAEPRKDFEVYSEAHYVRNRKKIQKSGSAMSI